MNNQNTTPSNPTNEKIVEELLSEMEGIHSFCECSCNQRKETKILLLKALQAKDEQARREKIELVESVPIEEPLCGCEEAWFCNKVKEVENEDWEEESQILEELNTNKND